MKNVVFIIFLLLFLLNCKIKFVTDEILEADMKTFQISYYITDEKTLKHIKDVGGCERDSSGINIYAWDLQMHIADTFLREDKYLFSNPVNQGIIDNNVSYVKYMGNEMGLDSIYFSADSGGYIRILNIEWKDGKKYVQGIFETRLLPDSLSLSVLDGHFYIPCR